MKRAPDAFGNTITVSDKIDDHFVVWLETSSNNLTLGSIYPDTKTFNVELGQLAVGGKPVVLSAKFMSGAKTFDKVTIGHESIALNSLLYLLSLPHGIQIDSFAELVYIGADFKFIQFKSRFEAMLHMCNVYEEYFSSHPDPIDASTIKLSDHELIIDTKLFIEASLLTIRKMATLKKGGGPYFLQLAKYYNYLRKNETNDD